MLKKSQRILNQSRKKQNDGNISLSSISRTERRRENSNHDLEDIFDINEDDVANMGYVDSLKMQEMQRFNLHEDKDFTVQTELARPFIEKEIALKEKIGPYQFSLY